jgi:hypothetical protein
MYQPGMDQGLAQTRYAEALDEAARERAKRKMQTVAPKPAAHRLALALVAMAPVAVRVVWTMAAH